MIDCDPNHPRNKPQASDPFTLKWIRRKRRQKGKISGKNGKKRRRMHLIWPFCYWCGKELSIEESTIDHLVPTSEGGNSGHGNIALSCGKYNSSRHLYVNPPPCGIAHCKPELCQERNEKAGVSYGDMENAAKGILPNTNLKVFSGTPIEAMRLVVLSWLPTYKNVEWVDSVFYKGVDGERYLYVVPQSGHDLTLKNRKSIAALGLAAGQAIKQIVNSRVCDVRLDSEEGCVEIRQ